MGVGVRVGFRVRFGSVLGVRVRVRLGLHSRRGPLAATSGGSRRAWSGRYREMWGDVGRGEVGGQGQLYGAHVKLGVRGRDEEAPWHEAAGHRLPLPAHAAQAPAVGRRHVGVDLDLARARARGRARVRARVRV